MVHKKKGKQWIIKRGDVFLLFDRSGKRHYKINGEKVKVQVNRRGKMVLLNELPKIEKETR